jgi:hypothetical protein
MPGLRRFTIGLPRSLLSAARGAPSGSEAAMLEIRWIDFYRR